MIATHRTSPTELEARLRTSLTSVIAPVFDQSLLKTELWLAELSAELLKKGARDIYDRESQLLRANSERARRMLREQIDSRIAGFRNIDPAKPKAATLSLIDESQMQLQLAAERLVDKLNHLHRKGLAAADQRISAVMGLGPYGSLLPFSPLSLADALRDALAVVGISDEFGSLVVRHFEAMVDPVLSDFLRDFNAHLAAAGVLPALVIQDEEERQRREKLQVKREARPPAEAPAEPAGKSAATAAPRAEVSEADRGMFASLVEMMGRFRQMFSGGRPVTRPLAPSETMYALDMMKFDAPRAVLDALSQPEGSVAESIKSQLRQSAARLGIEGEGVGLSPADDTAVEVTGHLFEVLLKDRPHAHAVAPILASLVTPIVKAAVSDPELFIQRHHPVRQLIDTVSEACEDNTGDTPQDKALLEQVQVAVAQVSEGFDGDLESMRKAEEGLSVHVQAMRKRAALAERRAGEVIGGQERLEIARRDAGAALGDVISGRELPRELQEFLSGHWKHHMSVTALRKGSDSEDWKLGMNMARHWMDLVDLVDLGEPLPQARLEELRESTRTVLATSGVQDDSSNRLMDELSRSLRAFDPSATAPAAMAKPAIILEAHPAAERSPPSLPQASPALPASSISASSTAMPRAAAEPAPAAVAKPAEATAAPVAPRVLNAEEQDFVASLTVGTWVQLLAANGVRQNAKVSWVSGISGLVMFVNSRGARIMALAPHELIEFRDEDRLTLQDRVSPVDDAMHRLLEKLKGRMPVAA